MLNALVDLTALVYIAYSIQGRKGYFGCLRAICGKVMCKLCENFVKVIFVQNKILCWVLWQYTFRSKTAVFPSPLCSDDQFLLIRDIWRSEDVIVAFENQVIYHSIHSCASPLSDVPSLDTYFKDILFWFSPLDCILLSLFTMVIKCAFPRWLLEGYEGARGKGLVPPILPLHWFLGKHCSNMWAN